VINEVVPNDIFTYLHSYRPEIFLETQLMKDNSNLMDIVTNVNSNAENANKYLIFCATVSSVTNVYYWLRKKLMNDGQVWRNGKLVGCRVELLVGSGDMETKEEYAYEFCQPGSLIKY